MMCPDGYVKLIDFGYAKKLSDRTYSVVGTVEYLAPEVIAQRGHMFGVDWWALGVFLYEMLCAFTPFTSGGRTTDEMQICKNVTSDDYRFAFPTWLDRTTCELILRLLTRNPVERLGSGAGGVRDIIDHPFFASIDFERLVARSLEPPHVPSIASEVDTSHFEDIDDSATHSSDSRCTPTARTWDYFF